MHVLPEGQWPQTQSVLGSNAVHLQVAVDEAARRLVVVGAVDNLAKGTGGAAVQCLNLAAGLDESLGLSTVGLAPMSVTHPAGFRAAGVGAGLKDSGGRDVALVVNDGPRHDSASVFTANRCLANPVLWSQEVVKDGVVRAVVLNSGGANCYTGPEGFQTTHATAERVAGHLGIGAGDVVVCSTGLIGLSNVREHLLAGVDAAHAALAGHGGEDAAARDHDHRLGAQADRRRGRRLEHRRHGQGRRHARPAAGHDARRPHHRRRRVGRRPRRRAAGGHQGQLRPARLRRLHVHQRHRHRDGERRQRHHAVAARPHRRAHAGLRRPRMQLLRDAEGSEHDIAITVLGADTEDDAVEVGRSIARCNLFKAAVFGKDPNWGRILASRRHHRRRLRPRRPRRRHQRRLGLPPLHARRGPPWSTSAPRGQRHRRPKSGVERATVWTNDLTHAYVHENSAYSS